MNHTYRYEYGRIVLLPLEESDIENLRQLRNSLRQYFLSSNTIEKKSQAMWYEAYLKKDNDIMFKIVKATDETEFIGAIAVYDIDLEKGVAEVGRTVVDKVKAPEKGIGMEATKAVCKFSFDVLGIKKIVAEVLKSNERIIKVDQRAGFYITGEVDENTYAIEMTKDTLND